MCKLEGLQEWQLYLVDWGYNTEEERHRANENPRISLLSLDTIAAVTGVGCA